MTAIELRILAAIRDAAREGLEATSIYLTPADRADIAGRDTIGGLPVRPTHNASRIYCRHGIARAIRIGRRTYRRSGIARPVKASPQR